MVSVIILPETGRGTKRSLVEGRTAARPSTLPPRVAVPLPMLGRSA